MSRAVAICTELMEDPILRTIIFVVFLVLVIMTLFFTFIKENNEDQERRKKEQEVWQKEQEVRQQEEEMQRKQDADVLEMTLYMQSCRILIEREYEYRLAQEIRANATLYTGPLKNILISGTLSMIEKGLREQDAISGCERLERDMYLDYVSSCRMNMNNKYAK